MTSPPIYALAPLRRDESAYFFCFFLETILDQIRFMGSVLDISQLRLRVEKYFQFLERESYREAFAAIVRVLVDEGEIPRSRVREITGKGATVAALKKDDGEPFSGDYNSNDQNPTLKNLRQQNAGPSAAWNQGRLARIT